MDAEEWVVEAIVKCVYLKSHLKLYSNIGKTDYHLST